MYLVKRLRVIVVNTNIVYQNSDIQVLGDFAQSTSRRQTSGGKVFLKNNGTDAMHGFNQPAKKLVDFKAS